MKNYILFLCALVTIAFASSCKSPTDFDTDRWSDKDTNNYPAQQELAGEWYLAHYETFGGAPDTVPNQMYMVNFETSKKATGKVNCNTFTVEYVAGTTPIGNTPDKALTFKNISTTKMNCGTADLDAKFITALNTSKQYFVFDKTLEITYIGANTTQSQRMIFKRKVTNPQPSNDLLKGTEWTLVSFENFNSGSEWIPLAQQENLNITFMGDSLATGMAECYKFSAEYRTNDKKIGNTPDYPLGITLTNSLPCGGNYGNRFLEALAGAKQYYRYGDSLEITYSPDNGITLSRMMFIKKNRPNTNPVGKSVIIVSPIQSNDSSDEVQTIDKPIIQGDTLTFSLTYSGGCTEHEFNLYARLDSADAAFPASLLVLTHNANGDMCNAIVSKEVKFNLAPLKEKYRKLTGKQSGYIKLEIRPPSNYSGWTFLLVDYYF